MPSRKARELSFQAHAVSRILLLFFGLQKDPMFRTLARRFLPNRLDWMLKGTARKGGKKILLGWNRGLGDIALGLYAIVQRIREFIPDAEITFLTRENLRDGFSLLEGVKVLTVPGWKRGEETHFAKELRKQYDLVIEKPSPTDWVQWQRGNVVPKLKWNPDHDALHEKFELKGTYVGVQVVAETNYGLWRNWPLQRWQELFDQLEKRGVNVLLFGFGDEPKFANQNIVDLRGKTTLFELLSIIKNRCFALVLPDSGISSMTYYLDAIFSIRLISLWADPDHGILKQRVASPNPQLVHCPLIGEKRDLSNVTADAVVAHLFPIKPLQNCVHASEVQCKPVANAAAILLAGGQGTRLGFSGPKGLFPIAGKTLFEWHCKKAPNAPLAIMTSPLNHHETVAYFKKHDFFGREIHFFQQEMIPFLDEEKRPLEMKGPNGNGSVFRSFARAGLGELFQKRGIEIVTISYVENPLIPLLDPALVTYAREQQADVVVQCIERQKSDRSMGALVEKKGIEIVEYTELDPTQEYKYAYSGQIAFALPFFCKMGEVELPLHWVRKKVHEKWVWKGEQFIFDSFPFASRVRAFCVPRETCYAPLKSVEDVEGVANKLRGTV